MKHLFFMKQYFFTSITANMPQILDRIIISVAAVQFVG